MPRKKRGGSGLKGGSHYKRTYKKVQNSNRNDKTAMEERNAKLCREKFRREISEGPIFPCFSCHRLLFKESVRKFTPGAITPCADLKPLLDDAKKEEDNGATLFMCRTCHAGLSKGKIPCQCYMNNLHLAKVPPELDNLNPLEERLIAQRIPFMKIVALACGGQKAIHGNCVNVPSKLDGICSLLPRIPEESQMVPLKIKRRLGYDKSYISSYVRPHKVNDAIRYLLVHNPLYRNCQYEEHWQVQWQNNEPELWSAMTQCENNQADETPIPSMCDFPEQKHSSMRFCSESHIETPMPSSISDFPEQKHSLTGFCSESPIPSVVSRNEEQKHSISEYGAPTPSKKIKVEHHETPANNTPLLSHSSYCESTGHTPSNNPIPKKLSCPIKEETPMISLISSTANNTHLLSHSSCCESASSNIPFPKKNFMSYQRGNTHDFIDFLYS